MAILKLLGNANAMGMGIDMVMIMYMTTTIAMSKTKKKTKMKTKMLAMIWNIKTWNKIIKIKINMNSEKNHFQRQKTKGETK